MANRAYAPVWLRGFAAATMLEQFERALASVPFAAARPGLTSLLIRAVDTGEAPLVEHDLQAAPLLPAEWIALPREHGNPDCACEAQAYGDLWGFEGGQWQRRPHRLEIVCYGEEFDGGAFAETGHIQIDLGFEHLFTGHAGVLTPGAEPAKGDEPGRSAEEIEFDQWARRSQNKASYREKTGENVRALLDWMPRLRASAAAERVLLWSEGEENFEARLEEILAAR